MPRPDLEPAEAGAGERLTPAEFAGLLAGQASLLWTVAAGVIGDPSEAEDVLQEAALMALGKLETFEPASNFSAWMARFVRNVALNHAKKRARRATHAVAPEAFHDLPEGAGACASWQSPVSGITPRAAGAVPHARTGELPVDARGQLRRDQTDFDDQVIGALSELGGVPRAALLLRTVCDQSYREIARVLDIPEGTAMSHVHRARRALRAWFETHGSDTGWDGCQAVDLNARPAGGEGPA